MSDDKNIQDGRDRSKVSGTEEYEVAYMAEKFGVSILEVRDAISSVGNSREAVEEFLNKKSAKQK